MAYKALVTIGDYKPGDTVPDEQAEEWLKMYPVPQVEKVSGSSTTTKKEKEVKPKEPKVPAWLDDYLARNEFVVKRALNKDKHPKSTLAKLLTMELASKKRKKIIAELKKQMEA